VARRLRPGQGHITAIAAIIIGKPPHSRRRVHIVGREIGASTCCCAASTAMRSLQASKFVTRLVRCNMVMARSARPTNCSLCVPPVAKPSGVPPRKLACGTCETGRREEQNGGGVSDLSDRGKLVMTRSVVGVEKDR
jgi:hypothetical protein